MYSEADYFFYYFVKIRELHIIPTIAAREWFKKNINLFIEKKTTTPLSNGSYYNTVGRLVPINTLREAVTGIQVINM